MPAYSNKTRVALLAMAAPLVRSARALFTAPDLLAAADEAEAAAVELELLVNGRLSVGHALSGKAAEVGAAELSLDRRVGGLSRGLDGLADLGLREAEALRDALFPEGLAAVTGPKGKAQAPQYTLLAERLHSARDLPFALRLGDELGALRADLLAWVDDTLSKDDAHRGQRRAVADASAAAEALRLALQRLDREVEREAGGPRADAYLGWAAAVRGVA